MENTPLDFHFIAHSHGVSVLDAISNWRKQLNSLGEHDPRYGAAFQGWFNGSITGEPFTTEIDHPSIEFKKIDAWIISSAAKVGQLAVLKSSNGISTLYLDEKFSAVLNAWNDSRPIVSMLNGNEHALTMLNRLPPYDFIDSEEKSLHRDATIIDELFIDQIISTWINAVYFSLVALRKSCNNQLIHILPPPPRENPTTSVHTEAFPDEMLAKGFIADHLRLKWYRRYCRKLTECLTAINCQVLEAPTLACNSNGLLKEEYAEGLTHGNMKYGVLVAEQIASTLQRPKHESV